MENKQLSPIVLFTYRRIPKETIGSLLENNLANKSELFIFSDGYKNEIDKQDVLEVRNYLDTINGFKSVILYKSDVNKGLANSIIDGVTKVINNYEKVIVLEDDVVVSEDFLEYMNEALSFYKDSEKIYSISGYTPSLNILTNYNKDIYLTQRGTSWAWATWIDRWNIIDWAIKDWDEFKTNKKLKKQFNLSGSDMYKMLELQMLGKLDSWAIRWVYNQFRYNKFSIFPRCSKAINIGFEDEKASNTSGRKWDRFNIRLCTNSLRLENIDIDRNIIKQFKQIHDISLYTKVGYFLKKNGGYKLIKKIINKLG